MKGVSKKGALVIEGGERGKKEKKYYLQLLELSTQMGRRELEQIIQFYPFGGKGEVLKTENYERVFLDLERGRIEGRVLILVDGDREHIETEKKVQELLEKLNEEREKRGIEVEFRYNVNCDPTTGEGAIEDLLLSAIPEGLRDCYTDFLNCLEQKKRKGGEG